ncbi:hypothetical protein HK096_002667, partial [Nowakowskiella sp. JEL0078]
MMVHAWDAYEKYAWGSDELMPLTLTPHNWYENNTLYSTPIDAMDTLYIMGLTPQFKKAKSVVQKLDFRKVDAFVSVFETNIRILGGLLSTFDLEGDKALLAKAVELADCLLKAFETESGIPINFINLATGDFRKDQWIGGSAFLAEAGSLQLEFQYLSDITGNPIYAEKALFALEQILAIPKPIPGMYNHQLDLTQLRFISHEFSVGACGDSFYEYLLKLWVSTGDERYWEVYYEAAQAVFENMATESVDGKFHYIPVSRGFKKDSLTKDNVFQHLSCFAGGMFSTGALAHRTGNWTEHLNLGVLVTETCFLAYHQTQTGLGAESTFENGMPGDGSYQM